MKVLCVLNPLAAGGWAIERWPLVSQILADLGLQYELLALKPAPLPPQVTARIHGDPDTFDAVAGIGGDGTHSAVINGLMACRAKRPDMSLPPYAFIPLGTGNDIAKSFGIQIRDEVSLRDLRRAVSTIIHGADYRLDLGVINGLYFADALTVGLDSRILRERNRSKRLIEAVPVLRHLARGRLLYTLSSGKPFFQQPQVHAEIAVDDWHWYSGPMINLVVNNTRIYAGEFDFSVEAYADDGRLDLVLFTEHRDYLAHYLLAMRHNPDRIRKLSEKLCRLSSRVQGERIRIRLTRPEPAQADGEELPESADFDVTVAPRALHVKIPAEPV